MSRASALAGLLAALLLPATVSAENEPVPELDLPEDLAALAPGLGGDARAWRALAALESGRNIEAREIAEEALAQDPDTYSAHCILGSIHGETEGNLARALHHFQRCLELYDQRHGRPIEDDPWIWHQTALDGLVRVSTDMGRYAEALAHLDTWEDLYGSDVRHQRSWVLANTGRLHEARLLSEAVLAEVEDPGERAAAWQILCLVAAEERDSETSHVACKRAVELIDDYADPVHLTNAAEAAAGVLEMDEAERWLVEASERSFAGTVASPEAELAYLYLYEGRLAEAVAAMREARAASRRQEAYVRALTRAWQDHVAAGVLLIAGHAQEAAALTARADTRPDRLGRISTERGEVDAAVALLDALANRTAAAESLERASWETWRGRVEAWSGVLRHRLAAWRSSRRAVALYSDPELLGSRIQPHAPGFVELAEWVELELPATLGPGVLAAAVADAEARGYVDREHGYVQAYRAEIARLHGRELDALAAADEALVKLPSWEVLLRARIAAAAAAAAADLGDDARALGYFDLVFQLDPGVVRRMELALPTRLVAAEGELAQAAVRLLRRSPRLRPAERGFRVEVTQTGPRVGACLAGSAGVRLACSEVEQEFDEAPDETARRLAALFHRRTFAPRVDLSQADLRALDGSTTLAAEHSREQIKLVLKDILAD